MLVLKIIMVVVLVVFVAFEADEKVFLFILTHVTPFLKLYIQFTTSLPRGDIFTIDETLNFVIPD